MNALLYALVALTWGSSFLFAKIGLDGLAPQQVATVRTVLGGVTLVVVLLATRRRWPREPRTWAHLAVVAVFLNAVPSSLMAWAEQTVPSERLRGRQVLGIVLGIVGVLVLVGPWDVLTDPEVLASVPGQVALLGMTASYGIGLAYLRRVAVASAYDPVTLATVQLTLASGMLLLVAPVIATGPVQLDGRIVAAMVALGCVGTGLAYAWNTRLVQAWGAGRASTVTYLTPVVGVALGVLVLGERVRWNEPVGGLVVLLGIALASGVLVRRREPAASAA
ncbi:DMT family transporter [Curtobacterium flaccumfaciens]|uniref:DMT family transporter n=1 Tax=Curtobacterium flaccumfaciens TaxID=2035 RepID=UPI001BDF27FD|nr:DMT family transporter [Curtobacterium flaccumfaciens]MBT1684814.1 DMT family transporter [Curtobacterium flaccumfaciens pv. flaccumfaciens]